MHITSWDLPSANSARLVSTVLQLQFLLLVVTQLYVIGTLSTLIEDIFATLIYCIQKTLTFMSKNAHPISQPPVKTFSRQVWERPIMLKTYLDKCCHGSAAIDCTGCPDRNTSSWQRLGRDLWGLLGVPMLTSDPLWSFQDLSSLDGSYPPPWKRYPRLDPGGPSRWIRPSLHASQDRDPSKKRRNSPETRAHLRGTASFQKTTVQIWKK